MFPGKKRLAFSLVIGVLFAAKAWSGEIETAGGQPIVGNGSTSTAYLAPSGIVSNDGSSFFLYVEGDDDVIHDTFFDLLYMYVSPATWSGLTSPFNQATKRTILPDPSQGQDTAHGYEAPFVFSDAGTYYMTVAKSPNAADFNEQLIGCSTDGYTWKWRTLFTTPLGNNIQAVTLRYGSIGGDNYWWGFLELNPCQLAHPGVTCTTPYSGIAAIRVHLASHAASNCASPTWDRVDFRVNGAWRSILPGQQITFTPDYISFNDIEPKLHWIIDHWELWTAAVSEPNYGCGCGTSQSTHYAAGFHYRTVGVGDTTLSPATEVYSQIRCLPGNYDESRAWPFRVEGTNLLYSMTKDVSCGAGPGGHYIVVTGLTP